MPRVSYCVTTKNPTISTNLAIFLAQGAKNSDCLAEHLLPEGAHSWPAGGFARRKLLFYE